MPDQTAKQPAAEQMKKNKSMKQEIISWVLTFAVAFGLALPIRTFLFQFVRVEGNSMAQTLSNGEIMFTTRLEYWTGDPQRFDIVICHYPGRTENFVKRVVGLPGDVVQMQEGLLIVNGVSYDEPFLTYRANYEMKPYTVPEGKYFVLGDNRANSNDSHLIGPIERKQIVGHVRAVVYPFAKFRNVQ